MFYSYKEPPTANAPWTWPYEPEAVVEAEVVTETSKPIDWSPLRNFVAEVVAYPLTLLTYLYK